MRVHLREPFLEIRLERVAEDRDARRLVPERRVRLAREHHALALRLANGHIEVARLLLAAGANKTKKDATGRTALKLAKTAEMKRLLR